MTTQKRIKLRNGAALTLGIGFIATFLFIFKLAEDSYFNRANIIKDTGFESFVEYSMKEQSSIKVGQGTEVHLTWPLSIAQAGNADILWSQPNSPIFVFDSSGHLLRKLVPDNEGSRRFESVTDISIDADGNIYVFDSSQNTVTLFGSTYTLLSSYRVPFEDSRRMSVDRDGNSYFLREEISTNSTWAIVKYDRQGEFVGGWGKIPKTAYLQRYLVGGGIATGHDGSVYYSYMSDHRLWKMDQERDSPIVYSQDPKYFRGITSRQAEWVHKRSVERRSAAILLRRAFNLSRVQNLFHTPSGFILQQVADKSEEGNRFFLEIWSPDGRRAASDVELPGYLAFATGSHMYFLDFDSKAKKKPLLTVYDYTIKS